MACQLPGLIKIITMPCERSGHRYCVSPPPPSPDPVVGRRPVSALGRYGNVNRHGNTERAL